MKLSFCTALLAAGIAAGPVWADDLEDRAAVSRAASATLLKALKDKVTGVAQKEGAVAGIGFCNLNALKVTAEIEQELGFEIGRTSHRLRQPKNAPDAWEQKVLEDFQARKAAGESLDNMEFYEVVNMDGDDYFRYMKAIPMGGVCYNCHGKNLRKDVKAKLDELYPDDKATGFTPGDLRGAFTIRQKM